jgi:hypothetical protein
MVSAATTMQAAAPPMMSLILVSMEISRLNGWINEVGDCRHDLAVLWDFVLPRWTAGHGVSLVVVGGMAF